LFKDIFILPFLQLKEIPKIDYPLMRFRLPRRFTTHIPSAKWQWFIPLMFAALRGYPLFIRQRIVYFRDFTYLLKTNTHKQQKRAVLSHAQG